MVSESEKLKREISVVREVMAMQQKKQECGWSELAELEEEITIPKEYSHLVDYSEQSLQQHLERLERDRQMIKSDDLFTDID